MQVFECTAYWFILTYAHWIKCKIARNGLNLLDAKHKWSSCFAFFRCAVLGGSTEVSGLSQLKSTAETSRKLGWDSVILGFACLEVRAVRAIYILP